MTEPSKEPPAPQTPVIQPDISAPANLKDMEKLFVGLAKNKGSDLHLKSGIKPIFRISTVLYEVGSRTLSNDDIKKIVYEILTDEQRTHFEAHNNLDFAYSVEGTGRFRVNLFKERGNVALAARRVNTQIPSFKELNLPPAVQKATSYKEGLIIVSGPTSSGKSTTLASMLQYINENRKCHIITVEDPIEYLFTDIKSFVNQREVGIDVASFHDALRYIVRQNPDVILMGEMRDAESLEAGLMAAETGHLVLGTLHASTAAQSVSRILDLFPTERQEMVRQSLTMNLRAIFCQRLLPGAKKEARLVPTVEVLLNNPSIQKLIQNKEDKKITDIMRSSEEEGMQDFNQSLHQLIKDGLIKQETGLKYSPNSEQLKMLIKGIFLSDSHKIVG
ncbi:MAG TPA: PilT/PilU family type 4a pilus ATPase [Planctomycetota bacterium]|nr:PilT/PilU family type 4a pilus ATPase [Planctomycetota bacterium]